MDDSGILDAKRDVPYSAFCTTTTSYCLKQKLCDTDSSANIFSDQQITLQMDAL